MRVGAVAAFGWGWQIQTQIQTQIQIQTPTPTQTQTQTQKDTDTETYTKKIGEQNNAKHKMAKYVCKLDRKIMRVWKIACLEHILEN